MISPSLDALRTALHLLGVAVWIGGQIVLAGVVPAVRAAAPDALGAVARAFARIAWPMFLLVVLTGVWGYSDIDVSARSTEYTVTFGVKMLLVAATAIAALIHSQGSSKAAKAIGGAAGLLTALAAAWFGVLLAHAG